MPLSQLATILFPRRGLGSQFVWLSLVLLLLLQVTISVVVQASVDNNARQQIEQELRVGDRIWWRLLDQSAQRVSQQAANLVSSYQFRSAVMGGNTGTAQTSLRESGANIGAVITAFLDANFALVASDTEAPATQLPKAELEKIAKTLTTGKTGYQLAVFNGSLHQFVLTPIAIKQKMGWVLMGFSIEPEVAIDMHGLSSNHVVVKDVHNKVLLSSLPASLWPGMASKDLGSELQTPQGTLIVLRSTAGQDFDGTQTYLLRSLNDAVAPYRNIQLALLGITGIGLLLFGMGSSIMAARITTPLRALVAAAEKLEQGQFDQPIPTTTPDSNEVSELAHALEAMRTSVREQKHTIEQLAFWDTLTHLPNRSQFRKALVESIQAVGQQASGIFAAPGVPVDKSHACVTIIMLNLDRFKSVNDSLGYAFGDQLLIAVARRLDAEMQNPQHLVARIGSDEFAVLMTQTTAEDAKKSAQRIVTAFEQPLVLESHIVDISAAIGLATWPVDGQQAEQLISRAEIAMYAAKQRTTGIQAYYPALEQSTAHNLSLLTELRFAIDYQQLRLYLQPKMDLGSRKIIAAEALVRWEHPSRGMVPPMEFIPFAEQTGFVRQITLWMFNEVAQQLPHLQAAGLMRVAINLSTRDLLDQDFPFKLDAILARHAVSSADFCLEITESAIMDDPARAEATLNALASRGFKLSIDDFGTGYSSLAYLKRLPVSELKIDRSFVKDMETDDKDAAIVQSTITMAHHLGLTVVAEGVETQGALEQLAHMACNEAQGYFIQRPMHVDQFNQWRSAQQGLKPAST